MMTKHIKKFLRATSYWKRLLPSKKVFISKQERERELDASCACRSLVYLCARTLVESDYFPLALHYVCVPYLDERRWGLALHNDMKECVCSWLLVVVKVLHSVLYHFLLLAASTGHNVIKALSLVLLNYYPNLIWLLLATGRGIMLEQIEMWSVI